MPQPQSHCPRTCIGTRCVVAATQPGPQVAERAINDRIRLPVVVLEDLLPGPWGLSDQGFHVGCQLALRHHDARAVVDAWRNEIVRPLRAVRRRFKSGPAPAPDTRTAALRRHVAKAELDAEMVELDELGKWADEFEAPTVAGSAIERATAAMEAVVQSYLAAPLDTEAAGALEAIATAAARCSEVR